MTLPGTERSRRGGLALDAAGCSASVEAVIADQARGLQAAYRARRSVARLARAAETALAAGGRLLIVGAGTSGRLAALEAAECPPTFGSHPDRVVAILAGGRRAMDRAIEGAEDDRGAGTTAVERARARSEDLVIGVTASGGTPFVAGALQAARRLGAVTALLCCNRARDARCAPLSDIVVAVPTGPEVVTGSTRLKAGTAQKAVLNAVTTAAFAAIGQVHGNLMVGVQATNAKLRARAKRIVVEIAQVDERRAANALRAADWDVKVATAMAALGIRAAEARDRLEASGGRLRPVLEEPA